MHELGIVIEIVKRVECFAKENNIKKVAKIILQIGEYSSALPHYMRQAYPAAVHGTDLSTCQLEIETITATGRCKLCRMTFPIRMTRGHCSHCQSQDYEMLTGRELLIKEIVVADN